MRYELPPGLTAEEERAILAALDEYFAYSGSRPSPWTLAGRTDALRLGALQTRNQSREPWLETGRTSFTHRGTESRVGRGDTK
ncbi:MAG TPA: hypothetical protein VF660_04520 [Actinomycetota bacterium]|jgi:hypothetical protein